MEKFIEKFKKSGEVALALATVVLLCMSVYIAFLWSNTKIDVICDIGNENNRFVCEQYSFDNSDMDSQVCVYSNGDTQRILNDLDVTTVDTSVYDNQILRFFNRTKNIMRAYSNKAN